MPLNCVTLNYAVTANGNSMFLHAPIVDNDPKNNMAFISDEEYEERSLLISKVQTVLLVTQQNLISAILDVAANKTILELVHRGAVSLGQDISPRAPSHLTALQWLSCKKVLELKTIHYKLIK